MGKKGRAAIRKVSRERAGRKEVEAKRDEVLRQIEVLTCHSKESAALEGVESELRAMAVTAIKSVEAARNNLTDLLKKMRKVEVPHVEATEAIEVLTMERDRILTERDEARADAEKWAKETQRLAVDLVTLKQATVDGARPKWMKRAKPDTLERYNTKGYLSEDEKKLIVRIIRWGLSEPTTEIEPTEPDAIPQSEDKELAEATS